MSKAYYPIQPISKTLLRGQETKDVKKENIPRPFISAGLTTKPVLLSSTKQTTQKWLTKMADNN